ncbi:uncharacterized protein MYCGRDRAFT_97841 [Zymoseptoria tritici IPO323]|uniref:Uncharacterized protein n=1 Tax=Zymoseptoria tritici (strain CBS 115943 / IPO323) TaxID=336722 RepID=F9XRJ5_ZYMTI|nr:uncharacterized protein MYCGRDRAFT_97841 [Zymoseptoria tritici IPO323]EGP82156.1 hypothetical protein MYCGRDRAFT_97841 [Zymoseptoria tritici IPO323]
MLLISTSLWNAANPVCLVPDLDHRAYHSMKDLPFLDDNGPEVSERINCIEAYATQAQHIRFCAGAAELYFSGSHRYTEQAEPLENQIAQTQTIMEKAEPGSRQGICPTSRFSISTSRGQQAPRISTIGHLTCGATGCSSKRRGYSSSRPQNPSSSTSAPSRDQSGGILK